MKPLRRFTAALAGAALLTTGVTGPAAAATAVEYGLLVGLLAI